MIYYSSILEIVETDVGVGPGVIDGGGETGDSMGIFLKHQYHFV